MCHCYQMEKEYCIPMSDPWCRSQRSAAATRRSLYCCCCCCCCCGLTVGTWQFGWWLLLWVDGCYPPGLNFCSTDLIQWSVVKCHSSFEHHEWQVGGHTKIVCRWVLILMSPPLSSWFDNFMCSWGDTLISSWALKYLLMSSHIDEFTVEFMDWQFHVFVSSQVDQFMISLSLSLKLIVDKTISYEFPSLWNHLNFHLSLLNRLLSQHLQNVFFEVY